MSRIAELTSLLMPHLMLAPIGLPMLTAALLLTMKEEQQRLKLGLNILSTLLGLLVAVALLLWSHESGAPATMGVYLPGNWPAPFGI
ncbi:MAG: cation:proton antiporter, partial [Diaphorobacter sp.]|nr:cation:proton antiporter [Diaphorobacter sp.]